MQNDPEPLPQMPASEALTAPPEVGAAPAKPPVRKIEEVGGPKGPDPTRFGDWSVNGRCIDF